MAVQEPSTWVIANEGYDQEAESRCRGRVAAGGIGKSERGTYAGSRSHGNHPKVVAMQVDWVRQRSVILNKPKRVDVGVVDDDTVVLSW